MTAPGTGADEDRSATAGSGSRPVETPPGPDGLPVLGNARSLVGDPWAFYEELSGYGDVVAYSVPGMEFCTLLHPDLIERVLVTDHDAFEKFGFEAMGGEFGNDGLLMTDGEQWRRQRTMAQDAFTLDRIRGYGGAMVRYAEEMVDGWDDGETVALEEEFSRLTLRVLCRSLFDLDLGDDAEVVRHVAAVLNDRGDVSSVTTFVPMWVPTPANVRFKRAVSAFDSFVDDLLTERRADPREFDDLLSLLSTVEPDDGHGMSDEELRDNMATFLFAGHETTSLALTYAVLQIAHHDDVRERLEAEYEAVLGDRPPEPADLDALTYTERVVRETLRLFPSVPTLFRQASEDVELGGYRVPAGTKVTLPQFHVHTDERWYDDPGQFDPDRWTDGFEASLPEYAYFPFGGGPRHCIGMRFAMQELKSVLPTVLRRVDVEPLSDSDPELELALTLRPPEEIRVRVHER